MRGAAIVLALTTALLASLPGGIARGESGKPGEYPDKPTLTGLLAQGRFEQLEQLLSEGQTAFEEGRRPERWVTGAFLAFANSDPALVPRLEAWRDAYPRSFAAEGALGVHFWHLGRHARGGRFASETPSVRFERMRDHHARALRHLHRALDHNPRFALAYARLIDIANLQGDPATEDWAYQRGLAAAPGSAEVRHRYMAARIPWWGGSQAEVEALAAKSREAAASWPDVAYLGAYDGYIRAMTARRAGRYDAAGLEIGRVLDRSQHWFYLAAKADILKAARRDEEALVALDRALAANDQVAGLWDDRALLLERLDRREEALDDWTRALAIDPFDPGVLRHKANVLWGLRRLEEAKALFDRALIHGDLEPRVLRSHGRFHLRALKDYDTAAQSFVALTVLVPDDPDNWYDYAMALWHLRDCKIMEALKTYLKLCVTETGCDGDRIWWATEFMAVTWWRGECHLLGENE